jgi:phosphinothricin acetyltransferase
VGGTPASHGPPTVANVGVVGRGVADAAGRARRSRSGTAATGRCVIETPATARPEPTGRDLVVRDATPADLPAVAAIYTHFVLRTTTTFNTEVRTPREWLDRFETAVVAGPYDLLVAERGGQVTGYVETQAFRPKPAYRRSIELSVYVAPDRAGSGAGSALYGALFDRLADSEFHRAYSVIALPNDVSVRFHERWGFVHRGTLTEAGHKFGRYLDVAFYERDLGIPGVRGDAPATGGSASDGGVT